MKQKFFFILYYVYLEEIIIIKIRMDANLFGIAFINKIT